MKHGGIVHRATMFLPYGVKTVLGYRYTKWMYRRDMKRIFGGRFTSRDPGPPAPPELITTEALMHAADLNVRRKPAWYFGSGYREAWTVLTTVQQHGADLRGLRSVLEFGCGSGRVLRHFRDIAGLQLSGTDANPKPIAWDKKNLPGIEFQHNQLEPPLAYPDGSFDLIYALSVFTHIPLEWQRPWLDELRRVLRPGGYLLCTVLGANYIETQLGDKDRAALRHDGELTFTAADAQASYSSQVLGSWDVFQTRERVREVFGANFELLCYTTHEAAAGQDTLVLRKPVGNSPRTANGNTHVLVRKERQAAH